MLDRSYIINYERSERVCQVLDRKKTKIRGLAEMAHSFRGGGKAAVGTGTLPVGFQGRSALAVGDNRREAKQLQ